LRVGGDDFEKFIGTIQGEDELIYFRCKCCRDGDIKQAGGVTEVEV
jgi:hypothetical protein